MAKKVVDLFCGAGGLSYGFKMADLSVELGIDKEEDFIKSFNNAHPETEALVADLSSEDAYDLIKSQGLDKEDVDIIIGGPPCQGFSTVGDRKEEDQRNDLVREFAHAVDQLEPDLFLMENVTGLKTMKDENGNLVIEELRKLFNRAGYSITYRILKAADYGVPQKRKRLFIVGKPDNLDSFNWPKPTHTAEGSIQSHTGELETYLTVEEAIGDLPNLESGKTVENYDSEPFNEYQKWTRKASDKLTNHSTPNHSETVLERLRNINQGENHGDLPNPLQLSSGYSNIYGRLENNRPADTITGNFGCVSAPGRFIHPVDDRALTVREGARLQSFPDKYKFFGNQSDQYKQVGNAVPPLMAKAVAESIKKDLERN